MEQVYFVIVLGCFGERGGGERQLQVNGKAHSYEVLLITF